MRTDEEPSGCLLKCLMGPAKLTSPSSQVISRVSRARPSLPRKGWSRQEAAADRVVQELFPPAPSQEALGAKQAQQWEKINYKRTSQKESGEGKKYYKIQIEKIQSESKVSS